MKRFGNPKSYPYIIVATAAIVMLVILTPGKQATMDFPIILFLTSQLCVLYGALELGICYLGKYEKKEDIYKAISRAITCFGMAACFIVIIMAYETAKGR